MGALEHSGPCLSLPSSPQSRIAAPAIAQTTTPIPAATASLSRIHIGNFGGINDNYFRGAQPGARTTATSPPSA